MSAAAPGTVVVTGAGGFIGRHLCGHLRQSGWHVRALVRDPAAPPSELAGLPLHACVLPGTIPFQALEGADAVIHCAYVTRHKDLAEAARVNEEGTDRLIEASRRSGSRFVFISSQSAHPSAESYYGRSKLALEGRLDPGRDLVIRPGLVLGPGDAGLFARMCGTVRRARVIPLFGGGRQPLQTVHIDDLCAAIAAALSGGLSGLFTVAEPEPIPMRRFLEMVAERLGRHPLFLPLPIGPALLAFRTLEALRVPFPVSSENLLGLRQMRAVDTRPDLAALGVPARPASLSLDQIFDPHHRRNR